MSKNRQYNEEFKVQAVKLAKEIGGKKAAAELNVPYNTLIGWIDVEETVYTYDVNGNQITKTADGKTETNTYDGLNQLIGFTDGETTASYTYDVDGLRLSKTVDGKTTKHVWDGNQQLVADVLDSELYSANCYLRGTNLVATYSYQNGEKSGYTYYTQNAQ
jgi:YD repeat-containing protein